MSQDWDIQPCGDACSRCGVAFADRQPYFSALFHGQAGYERRDFCDSCRAADEVKACGMSHGAWKGLYRPPAPPVKEVLKKENAESLLRKYMESADESKKNVIFVLAVMLERKKILVERDIKLREDGTQILVYEHRKTGEVFMVPDPRLKLAQLESIQAEVGGLLGLASGGAETDKQPPQVPSAPEPVAPTA